MEFALTPPMEECHCAPGSPVLDDLSRTLSRLCGAKLSWGMASTPGGRAWYVLRPRPAGKYWPTPTTMDAVANRKLEMQMKRHSLGMAEIVRVGMGDDMVLNPDFSAQVMGVPDGWLDV